MSFQSLNAELQLRYSLILQTNASQSFISGDMVTCEAKLRQAIDLLEKLLDKTKDKQRKNAELQLANAYTELAACCQMRNHNDEVQALRDKALSLQLKYADNNKANEFVALKSKAKAFKDAEKYSEALLLFNEARQIGEELHGKESGPIVYVLVMIANTLSALGRTDECLETERRIVAIREKNCVPNEAELALAYLSYGMSLLKIKDYPQAEIQLRKSLAVFELPRTPLHEIAGSLWQSKGKSLASVIQQVVGIEHPSGILSVTMLINVLLSQNKFDEIDGLYNRALGILTKRKPVDKNELRKQVARYAKFLRDQNRPADALALERKFTG